MAKLVPDGCPKFILTLPKVIFPSLAIILPGIGLNILRWCTEVFCTSCVDKVELMIKALTISVDAMRLKYEAI